MNFELTDEQELIEQTARDIAQEEFAEAAFSWDGDIPGRTSKR